MTLFFWLRLLQETLKELFKKKKTIKTINIKKATNSQLSTAVSKNNDNNRLRKQPEQEQNQSYRGHFESYQWGGEGQNGVKVQGLRSIKGKNK